MTTATTPRLKAREVFTNLRLAIVGPGGTGKTAVLKLCEALTNFFAGPDTVHKLAPSNAAARLLGGDTIHALCKLPFGNQGLSSKKGRLTKASLSALRKKWSKTVAAYVDEISMVSADQFLQCDVRMRQAKMVPQQPFGGLAVNICGDSLQLPPVDKDGSRRSLAMPLDDSGHAALEDDEEEKEDSKKATHAESRQGFELWRSIRRVVCLTVTLREHVLHVLNVLRFAFVDVLFLSHVLFSPPVERFAPTSPIHGSAAWRQKRQEC